MSSNELARDSLSLSLSEMVTAWQLRNDEVSFDPTCVCRTIRLPFYLSRWIEFQFRMINDDEKVLRRKKRPRVTCESNSTYLPI